MLVFAIIFLELFWSYTYNNRICKGKFILKHYVLYTHMKVFFLFNWTLSTILSQTIYRLDTGTVCMSTIYKFHPTIYMITVTHTKLPAIRQLPYLGSIEWCSIKNGGGFETSHSWASFCLRPELFSWIFPFKFLDLKPLKLDDTAHPR